MRGVRTHVIALERDLPQPPRRPPPPGRPPSRSGSRTRMPADCARSSTSGPARPRLGLVRRAAGTRSWPRLLRSRPAPSPGAGSARDGVAEPRRARAAAQRPALRAADAGPSWHASPEPPTLYARGLVGCLDEDGRRNLWRLGSMSLRRGGSLFLEYAATTRRRAPLTTPGLVTGAALDASSARSPPPADASYTRRSAPETTSSTSPTRRRPARGPLGPPSDPTTEEPP